MDTLQKLCDDARDKADLEPDANADRSQVALFNAKLNEFQNFYPHDSFINAIPAIKGEISNHRMFIRARNLRAALLTASNSTGTELLAPSSFVAGQEINGNGRQSGPR